MTTETPEQTERRIAKHTADTFAAIFGAAIGRPPTRDELDTFADTLTQPIAPEVQS